MKTSLFFLLLLLFFSESAMAQNWRRIEGMEGGILSVAVNPRNKNSIWFGGFAKIFVSYDGGRTATRIIENAPGFRAVYITAIFIHPQDTTFILAAGTGCWQSRDNGSTWRHALPDTDIVFNGEAIAHEPRQPDTLYVAPFLNRQDRRRIFFRSLDRGATWTEIPIGIDLSSFGFCSLSAGGAGVLLGGIGARGLILRSTNQGTNWTQVFQSADSTAEVPKITFNPQEANEVWAAVFGRRNGVVLKSSTGGSLWTTFSLPGNPWAIEIDGQGRVYAGMFNDGLPGAFVTFDEGRTWKNYSSGFPPEALNGQTWMIKSNGDPFGVFLADGNFGAFKLQNFDEVQIEEKTPLPRRFILLQNYPNPFNPATVIEYTLAAHDFVELTIQNVSGETIRILRRQFETAGSKSVTWEGKDEKGAAVSSGIYVCTLRAGKEIAHKKMIVMK